MRLFLAIPLAAEAAAELAAISRRLQSSGSALRWSAPESWHVTLQFLGDTGPEQYGCTVARLRELRMAAVPIRLERIGFFERAGVFFIGVGATRELVALQRRVVETTALCGFVPEDRPYQPHITLARSKGKEGRQQLSQLKTRVQGHLEVTRFLSEEFRLYESVPGPSGSRYEIRERFFLGRPTHS